MNMQDIITKARGLNIEAYGKDKRILIQEIQIAEGNFPCYCADELCGQPDCLWRADCQKKS